MVLLRCESSSRHLWVLGVNVRLLSRFKSPVVVALSVNCWNTRCACSLWRSTSWWCSPWRSTSCCWPRRARLRPGRVGFQGNHQISPLGSRAVRIHFVYNFWGSRAVRIHLINQVWFYSLHSASVLWFSPLTCLTLFLNFQYWLPCKNIQW